MLETKFKLLSSFIVDKAGTRSHLIQEAEVFDNFSFVTVPFIEAEIIIDKFRKNKNHGRPIVQEASSGKKSGNKNTKRRRR